MNDDARAAVVRALEEAEAEVATLRAANSKAADAFRDDPNDSAKAGLKRGAADLAAARDRLDAAKVALGVFEKTGTPYGLVADEGRVAGVVAVEVKPGTSREARERAVDDVLLPELTRACDELGVVLATTAAHYTRERPGRDADGKTVLEVAGRVEGDRLIPAISKASKNLRN
ncbi:MAG TPA: hypothetical protein VGM56_14595 [Byssovorax sp.]